MTRYGTVFWDSWCRVHYYALSVCLLMWCKRKMNCYMFFVSCSSVVMPEWSNTVVFRNVEAIGAFFPSLKCPQSRKIKPKWFCVRFSIMGWERCSVLCSNTNIKLPWSLHFMWIVRLLRNSFWFPVWNKCYVQLVILFSVVLGIALRTLCLLGMFCCYLSHTPSPFFSFLILSVNTHTQRMKPLSLLFTWSSLVFMSKTSATLLKFVTHNRIDFVSFGGNSRLYLHDTRHSLFPYFQEILQETKSRLTFFSFGKSMHGLSLFLCLCLYIEEASELIAVH
jgi:hypothetical protein